MFIHRNNGSVFLNNTAIGSAGEIREISLYKYKIKQLILDLTKKEILELIESNTLVNAFQQKKGFEITTHEGSSFDTVSIIKDCWITSFNKSYTKDDRFYVEDLEINSLCHKTL